MYQLQKESHKHKERVLTADAGAEKHFQNQISSCVQDGPCCHGNESQSQVLDRLHADRHITAPTSLTVLCL